MRIAVVGGGPGGLYFAALAMQLDPAHEITVWERNAADDTFGFGVVFSDATLGNLAAADRRDPPRRSRASFARWDDIEIHDRGQVIRSGGHGFAGDEPAAAAPDPARARAGARRELELPDTRRRRADELARDARPGRRLRRRELRQRDRALAGAFRPQPRRAPQQVRVARHRSRLRRVHVLLQGDAARRLAVHAYPFDATGSTFIVECTTTCGDGPASTATPIEASRPESDEASIAEIRRLFAGTWPATRCIEQLEVEQLPDGAQRALARTATSCCSATRRTPRTSRSARAPSSRWRTRSRSPRASMSTRPCSTALAAYEAERAPEVERCSAPRRRASSGSRTSALLRRTRTRSSSRSTCSRAAGASRTRTCGCATRRSSSASIGGSQTGAADGVARARGAPPPMFTPFRLRGLGLTNRVVVSPMCHVLRRRRHAERLPPRAPRQRARWAARGS